MLRIFAKLLIAFFLLCLMAVGGAYALFNAPGLLFPYHVHEGRLELWSDQPFQASDARRLLADAQARLARSVLDDHRAHGVVIANIEWHRHLMFLWNDDAAGLNWYPITRNVFIRSGNIAEDRVIRPTGKAVEPPRTLAYYIAHEIGHTLTAEHVGVFRYHRDIPRWLREGVADYIGLGGKIEIEKLERRFRFKNEKLDPIKSDPYARYRLLVAELLDRKGWTMDRLLQSGISLREAETMVFGKRE